MKIKRSIMGFSTHWFLSAIAILTVVAGLPAVSAPVSAAQLVIIGTGGVKALYYPTGGAICRLVNKQRKRHGIRCTVESSGGSVYNLSTIRKGELDLGVVQSDWQYHAYHGTSEFKDAGPHKKLRAVFSVYPEPVTIVARRDSGIRKLNDLLGKRVNLGNPGSGTLATAEVMLVALGWKKSDFKLVTGLESAEQAKALCDNKIDAFYWVVGHPSGTIKEATSSCDTVIIPVVGKAIDELVAKNSYYRYATIPGGMYTGTPNDVKTYGVGATLVTSTAVPENVVYEIVKAVFENFDNFQKLHPAYGTLTKESMVKDSLSAPLHPGAMKYYKHAGLLQ